MESFEKKLKKETDTEFVLEEFKKYKLEQISFEDLFAELSVLRKEAIEKENPILLKVIDKVGEEMQEEEKKRMEEAEAA